MRRIGFIVIDNVSVMSFAPVSAFELANQLGPKPLYDLHMLSEHGGSVRTSMGMNVETRAISTPAWSWAARRPVP
jgi:transcriptional regulator GlxA family with amidase domain